MGNIQVARVFQPYTVSVTNEAPGFPKEHVQLYGKPFRTLRSTTSTPGAWSVVLDCGAVTPVGVLFLNAVNFSTARIEAADDTGFSTNYVDHGFFPLPINERLGDRRMGWCALAAPSARRYYRVTPFVSPDGGASYFEVGVVAAFTTANVITLASNPGAPWRWVRQHAHTRLAYAGGGEDIAVDGRPYLELVLASDRWRKNAVLTQLLTLLDVGPAGYFVLYENRGAVQHAYLVQWAGPMPVAEWFHKFSAELTLREAI